MVPSSPVSTPRGGPASNNGHRSPCSTPRHLRTPSSFFHRSPFAMTPPTGAGGEQHPVEVIGRIREHPDGPNKPSSLLRADPTQEGLLRVRSEQGYRDFTLDGASLAAEEDLRGFYKRYVEPRVGCVSLGGRCTVLTYGPTGAGKSRTMFGTPKEPGILYLALQQILMTHSEDKEERLPDGIGAPKARISVNTSVLEIYNEDIFDLLASAPTMGWFKNNSRARVEIMGKKAKNTTSISGNDAHKITKEIAKVEKRRVVKSTLCNDRSSRSHCVVMLEVPSVGGKLVFVDMAGSENIDQAGLGFDAKMQTGKINQGNAALKRVVEAIANGDSYIPFRDSKLTMLLQDSFEDDKAKILMILCASPDMKDIHKTICTLEYGAKAKCIFRLPISCPTTEKTAMLDEAEQAISEARIRAMDELICKLQEDNRRMEKEREKLDWELMKREKDMEELREKIQSFEDGVQMKLDECRRLADEFVEYGKRKLEERIRDQEIEIKLMHARMEEIENELLNSEPIDPIFVRPDALLKRTASQGVEEGSSKRTRIDDYHPQPEKGGDEAELCMDMMVEENEDRKAERKDGEEEEMARRNLRIKNIFMLCGNHRELAAQTGSHMTETYEESPKQASARKCSPNNGRELIISDPSMSLADWLPMMSQARLLNDDSAPTTPIHNSPAKNEDFIQFEDHRNTKENLPAVDAENCDVYVKWETSQSTSGKIIRTLKMGKGACLAELRRSIESLLLDNDRQDFTFLMLGGDPSGAPVERDLEAVTKVASLPDFHCKKGGSKLACLRVPMKRNNHHHLGLLGGPSSPFASMENRMTLHPHNNLSLKRNQSPCASPKVSATNLLSPVNLRSARSMPSSGSQVRGLRL